MIFLHFQKLEKMFSDHTSNLALFTLTYRLSCPQSLLFLSHIELPACDFSVCSIKAGMWEFTNWDVSANHLLWLSASLEYKDFEEWTKLNSIILFYRKGNKFREEEDIAWGQYSKSLNVLQELIR